MNSSNDSAKTGIVRLLAAEGIEDEAYAGLLHELVRRIDRGQLSYVSFGGAQGSGKSTMARLLGVALEQLLQKSVVLLSLDDFYLTRSERGALAEKVHPMLAVRGVPGTHDIDRLAAVVADLRTKTGVTCPVFDKAADDRDAEISLEPGDVIIGEGWCWGARPQPPEALTQPVNALETEEDPDGVWRTYVNDALSGTYQAVFSADLHIFLEVPSMGAVIRWRWQQERQMREATGRHLFEDVDDVAAFVAYYERLTRWMISDSRHADAVVELDESHRISDIYYR